MRGYVCIAANYRPISSLTHGMFGILVVPAGALLLEVSRNKQQSMGWKFAGPNMQETSRFTLALHVLHAAKASRNIDFLLRDSPLDGV
jgi:hypothetical protein